MYKIIVVFILLFQSCTIHRYYEGLRVNQQPSCPVEKQTEEKKEEIKKETILWLKFYA